jgi:anthranilate phosphoribosyltransferase
VFKDSLGELTRNQDLTTQEVTEFVEGMRDDQVTEAQTAGFLVALLMKGPTESPEEGLRLAHENIDSGAATRKLTDVVEASQAFAPTNKA